jgi:hypothetical protein
MRYWRTAGNRKPKGAALPQLAVDPDATAMCLDHHLTEGEPKTSRLLPGGLMHGNLPKLVEDVIKRFTGDTRACISHAELHGCSVRTGVDGDSDLTAGRRKFEGIAE